MAGLQLSGLASGFDWKSLVDQLMSVANAPVARIQAEQSVNTQRVSALSDLGAKLAALQTSATTLKDQTLFSGRLAASKTSASTWTPTATAGAATGSYAIAVSQLATKARLEGASNITEGLNASSDVSALTISTLHTGTAVTAGTFTVNGQKVTVATTDSLAAVFTAIATATTGHGDVTASYDPLTDKVTLSSASAITIGAANDTSNFLRVMKLDNGGGTAVTSSAALGSASLNSTLATAGLTTVPVVSAGTFTINGVDISYDVATDSLGTIISRINAAGAGVTATYDKTNDRLVLGNNTTGDLGHTVSEAAGGLLGALGLTTGATAVAGENAEFTVDGGPTLYSNSNTLDATAHGLTGLSVTVDSVATQTIEIKADTAKMRGKIEAFIKAYNDVQTFLDEKTKITTLNGKVTTSVLSGNREIQAWGSSLRSLAFGALSGISGTVTRLENLGIDFDGSRSALAIEDGTKLDAALLDHPGDVEAFFTTATDGFAAKFDALLTSLDTSNDAAQTRLTSANTSLSTQIADLTRRLTQQREVLTSSFISMETAQSQLQTQASALTRAFPAK